MANLFKALRYDSVGQRRIGFTTKRDSPPDFEVNAVDRADSPRQLGGIRGGKTQSKIADYLPEFRFGDFQTLVTSVFVNKNSKIS